MMTPAPAPTDRVHDDAPPPLPAWRLFTSLFEAFLVPEPERPGGPPRLPLALYAADVGAIWAALARLLFGDQRADSQLRPGDSAMRREELRQSAVARLTPLTYDRALLEQFCALAQGFRDRLFPEPSRALPPVGPAVVADALDILVHWPHTTPIIAEALTGPPLDAGQLSETVRRLGRQLAAAGLSSLGADHLPLALLHRRGALDLIAEDLRSRGIAQARRPAEALAGQMGHALHDFAALCHRLLPETRRPETAILLDADLRPRLPGMLERLESLIQLNRRAGIFDADSLRTRLLDTVNGPMSLLAQGPLIRSNKRLAAALMQRDGFPEDWAEVAEIAGLMHRLRLALRPTGLPIHALQKWQHQIEMDLDAALHQATRLGEEGRETAEPEAGELAARFEHLLRVENAAGLVGVSIAPLLPAASRNTQMILAARLEQPDDLAGPARALCAAYAAAIRAEIGRVRYWRNPEMVSFAELADRRGL